MCFARRAHLVGDDAKCNKIIVSRRVFRTIAHVEDLAEKSESLWVVVCQLNVFTGCCRGSFAEMWSKQCLEVVRCVR